MTLYTIGHSTRALDVFVELLHAHGVVQLADVRLDLFPVIRLLEDRLVGGVRARRVAGDEDRLGDPRVEVLQDAEEERSAARVPDEDGSLVKCVVREHGRQERLDRVAVEAGAVRDLDGVSTRLESYSEPRIPAVLRVAARPVEDDRVGSWRLSWVRRYGRQLVPCEWDMPPGYERAGLVLLITGGVSRR